MRAGISLGSSPTGRASQLCPPFFSSILAKRKCNGLTAETVWASPLSWCLDLCPPLSNNQIRVCCRMDDKLLQAGTAGIPGDRGGWRLKKGLQAGLLKADWCCVSREHEKEVQNRKRGKRPRGRPRKHTVMSSCSRRSKLKVSGHRLCTDCLLVPHPPVLLWAEVLQGSC